MAQAPTVPPYVGFGIFNGVIETLAETTVPNGPIDRRVLDKLSGADYGAFMSAARFFDMVDENRVAKANLRELVKKWKLSQDEYKEFLLQLVLECYQPILGHVDLDQGTAAQLEKAFKDAGVSQGQMLTKTIRFLVKASLFCGAEVSPHILKGSPRPKNGDSKPRQKKKQEPDKADTTLLFTTASAVPSGFERMPIPGVSGAYIQYPTNLTVANCELFAAMVVALKAYAQARSGKEKG